MKRADAKRHDSHKPEPTQPPVPIVASREIHLSPDRDELLGLMQDSLESVALKLGILVASSLLEDEVTRLCGRRHERQPHRTHTRYGHRRGTATLAGQKIPIARPRVRRTDGGGEPSAGGPPRRPDSSSDGRGGSYPGGGSRHPGILLGRSRAHAGRRSPPAMTPDGRRLAKRDGSIKLSTLREADVDPRRLVGGLV